jgi:hypothetical protein
MEWEQRKPGKKIASPFLLKSLRIKVSRNRKPSHCRWRQL